ncbi:hypothetical protein BFC17_21960 [Alteromonas lipolytica]|uniref:Uncharacterized protein n=2 Tax=Alteromonas lipolytica TaxID=1856405 RepID=A0A1E8FE43_9ALTE|nr:hypothetical protein BFC17_21960 [Alteromonas lipolytica]
MTGRVENWLQSELGSTNYKLDDLCADGASTDELIKVAIRCLGLSSYPQQTHLNCRHKRWQDSYILCFEIATILALQYNFDDLMIINGMEHIRRHLPEVDPKYAMKEHPGAFQFFKDGKSCWLSGDGRLLNGGGSNLWEQYMAGDSAVSLANSILSALE